MQQVKTFFYQDSGLELSEYAIASGLITLAVAVAITSLGDSILMRIEELMTWATE